MYIIVYGEFMVIVEPCEWKDNINFKGELANKTDNCTVSYKHHTGIALVQWNNGACMIIPHLTVDMKHHKFM